MLKIKIADYTTELNDEQLSIVRTSPFPGIATGTQAGNYIFNFTLPATPGLKEALKYVHRPQVQAFTSVPYRIDAGAGLIWEGNAQISEASSETYEIFCPVENGDFNWETKQVKLNELDLGGNRDADIGNIRCDAIVPYEIHIDLSDNTPFVYNEPFSFNEINSNIDGELNTNGDTFTSSENGKINLKAKLEIYSILNGGMYFKAYKNSEQIYSDMLNFQPGDKTENFEIDIEIDVVVGDVITWHIYVLSILAQDQISYTLAFKINANSSLLIYRYYSRFVAASTVLRYPDIDFAIFPVENPLSLDNWDDDFYQVDNFSIKDIYSNYFKVLNYWKNSGCPVFLQGEVLEGEDQYKSFKAGNIIVPFPYVGYLMKQIAKYFKYSLVNNPFEAEFKYVTLINHFIENDFLEDDTKLIAPKPGFDLADHVPGWTVYDFLQNLTKTLGLGFEVDNYKKEITFTSMEDLMINDNIEDISHLVTGHPSTKPSQVSGIKISHKKPTADKYFDDVKTLDGTTYKGEILSWLNLPPIPEVNDCYFIKTLGSYYVYKYNPETYTLGWVVHSKDFTESKTVGDEDLTLNIESSLVPCLMRGPERFDDVIGAPEGRGWLIPASYQPGQFEGAPEMFQAEWVPLLAYYHGLYPDTQDNDYPYANSDIVDPDGNIITGMQISLRLQGENGLWEKRWKRFAEWRLTAKEVVYPILPDNDFLRKLKFNKKYIINGVRYIMVDFRGAISRRGPEPSEITLLRF